LIRQVLIAGVSPFYGAAVVVSLVNHDTVHPGRLVSLDSTCADAILDGSSASRKCALSSTLFRRVKVPLALR